MSNHFPGRLALTQRVLPAYRAPFFDMLAEACQDGLGIFAGNPLPIEGIATRTELETAQVKVTHNRHFSDPSSSWYLCWQDGVIDWLESQNPAALIVEANPRYFSTRLAVRWMQARGRPVLGWGLGAPVLTGALAGVRRWNRQRFTHSLDGMIAYSQRGASQYRALGLEKVFVAHNAAAPRPTQRPSERSDSLNDGPTILFVGRLQARKRLDILIRACAATPESSKPRLIIVGDGPARSEYQALAQEIFPQAAFVGAVHGDALEPYFAAADLFALPGTGGLAVQQAMTHGLPVIVAQGDGTQDDLVRPGNGWQVPPGDEAVFTETLHGALSDIPRLRRMGAESYRIVRDEINLEMMVGAFIGVLNQYLP
ncbi:MAG: glycosyltransferase [Chloroflexota bacterium]